MSTQKALLLLEKQGDLAVRDIEVPTAGPGELLVKVHSAGVNPSDWKIAKYGIFVTQYPAVLGSDAAGTVAAVGEGVTGFQVGDRVLHQWTLEIRGATFQQYSIVPAPVAAKIPANLSFDEAATVPLVLTTAAFGLYSKPAPRNGGAGFTPFWAEGGCGKYAGTPLVILGGTSAVGQQVIQLARLSGFSPIITTASLHNESLLKSLGATHVVDRSAPLADAIKAATSQPIMYVYDAISVAETENIGWEVLAPGGTLLLVSTLVLDSEKLEKGKKEGKTTVNIFGGAWEPTQRELGIQLYAHLTAALESQDLKPTKVEVLPDGLAGIPDGLERLRLGKVSAVKLIAHPQETA